MIFTCCIYHYLYWHTHMLTHSFYAFTPSLTCSYSLPSSLPHSLTHIAAGGADCKVKLWEVDSGVCLQEYAGHNDVVRDIKIVSHQVFISAANDRCCSSMLIVYTCSLTLIPTHMY